MEEDLTPRQKFDQWLINHKTEPDVHKWSLERVYTEALELGYDKSHVDKVIEGLRVYYHNNANFKNLKARKLWGRAIMKNLAPKNFNRQASRRLTPSKF